MATLGRSSSSGFGNQIPNNNQIVVYRATLAAAGHLDELWASLRIAAGTSTFRCVIFDDDGASGEPGTLLAVGADIAAPVGGSRLTRGGAVVTPLNLAAGNYWLGIHAVVGGGAFVEYDDDGSGLTRRSTTDTFSDGTASPWAGTASSVTGSMQVWGVLSAPVTSPPVAAFTGTPLSGVQPLSVTFTDTSTNTPTSWAWTFGDGGTSTSQNPSHTYAAAGTYTVALTATNSAGSNTLTRTGYITVADQPRPIRINTSQGWRDIGDDTAFVSGSGLPTTAVGATGAIYLNTATGLHYGPKAAGAWPGTALPVPAGTPSDATTSAKGIVQLAGDLAGTAASPQIAAGVIVDADVAAANKDGTAATPSLRTLGTGAAQAAAGNDPRFPPVATSLPASPVDGQQVILVNSTTSPLYYWHMRYMASSGFTEKWVCIGGVPYQVFTATSGSLVSGWNAGLPNLTVPFNGAYITSGQAIFTPAAACIVGLSSWHDGALDANNQVYGNAAAGYTYRSFLGVGSLLTLNDTLWLAFNWDGVGSSVSVNNRLLQIMPIRLR